MFVNDEIINIKEYIEENNVKEELKEIDNELNEEIAQEEEIIEEIDESEIGTRLIKANKFFFKKAKKNSLRKLFFLFSGYNGRTEY
jgi:Mg/Co/Ni transporter MgtE